MYTRRHSIWPTLPPNVYLKRSTNWRPFPLDQTRCRIFSLARHAILNASKALHLGKGDVILVPAYHHGSEVEALMQAGLQVIYYEVNDELEPDSKELQTLLSPNVKALYIIHYLGFPQKASFWRQWCDERGLLLFEDAAQAFLAHHNGQPVGSFGHVGVFCLYKTYGIPDGGALISTIPPAAPQQNSGKGWWKVFKRHVNWIAARRGEIGAIHLLVKPIVSSFKRMTEHTHKEFEVGNPSTSPSTMTIRLLPKLLNKSTADRRRENYEFLLSHLGDMVPYPFSTLPEGACPFAFPVEVADAKEFLNRLHSRGVVGLLFWLNPHPSLLVADFPKSRDLREKMLALPVHQELTKADLKQIVKAVQECRIDSTARVATFS
ncbi:aminotransferase class V-fold PLP-dependent enzyme [Pontibacter ruber]|uniref:Aminotransferase class V-fold PLP-dependent enzyme n=1 Tax=Pontibacter ruber TaxID=1343895 RepID=A0ABW5D0Z5_9BACT|nr:aminotransferase class V-fold PLP-dependent enzyme [Pontibacter ruber]